MLKYAIYCIKLWGLSPNCPHFYMNQFLIKKIKSPQSLATLSFNLGCRGKTRTYDLRVMSHLKIPFIFPKNSISFFISMAIFIFSIAKITPSA